MRGAGILQSVERLATDWTVRGSIQVGTRFSAPVQTDPGAHPASYTMGTGSFQGVKRSGRGVDHPLTSNAEVKERVGLYIYYPSGPSWPDSRVKFTFNFSFTFIKYRTRVTIVEDEY